MASPKAEWDLGAINTLSKEEFSNSSNGDKLLQKAAKESCSCDILGKKVTFRKTETVKRKRFRIVATLLPSVNANHVALVSDVRH